MRFSRVEGVCLGRSVVGGHFPLGTPLEPKVVKNGIFGFSEHARKRAEMMLFEPDGMFGGKITQKMRFLAGI